MKVSDMADGGDVLEYNGRLYALVAGALNLQWHGLEVDGDGRLVSPLSTVTVKWEAMREGLARKVGKARGESAALINALRAFRVDDSALMMRVIDYVRETWGPEALREMAKKVTGQP
jgi:hypothetical protein